jgi:hypothetical protein
MTDYYDPDTFENWNWDDIWGGAVDFLSDLAYPVLRWLIPYWYDDFYIKPNTAGGDDRNSGTEWSDAWATVGQAAKTIGNGKTAHVKYGTYNETENITFEKLNSLLIPVFGSEGLKLRPENEDGTQTSGGEVIINLS